MQHTEQGDGSVLVRLFDHNAWANRKLLDFCAGLSEAQLDATAVGGFGSIRDTLLHFVTAEVSYVNQVNGRLPATPPRRGEWPGFAALRDAAQWTGDELRELALGARADTLVQVQPPREPYEYPLAALMVQALTHSCEHRAQVATIITQLGLEPPDLSGWGYMEERGELRLWREDSTGV